MMDIHSINLFTASSNYYTSTQTAFSSPGSLKGTFGRPTGIFNSMYFKPLLPSKSKALFEKL